MSFHEVSLCLNAGGVCVQARRASLRDGRIRQSLGPSCQCAAAQGSGQWWQQTDTQAARSLASVEENAGAESGSGH